MYQFPDVTIEILKAPAVHGAVVHDGFPRLSACRNGLGDRGVDVLFAVCGIASQDSAIQQRCGVTSCCGRGEEVCVIGIQPAAHGG